MQQAGEVTNCKKNASLNHLEHNIYSNSTPHCMSVAIQPLSSSRFQKKERPEDEAYLQFVLMQPAGKQVNAAQHSTKVSKSKKLVSLKIKHNFKCTKVSKSHLLAFDVEKTKTQLEKSCKLKMQ
jgi:hypothetical protein